MAIRITAITLPDANLCLPWAETVIEASASEPVIVFMSANERHEVPRDTVAHFHCEYAIEPFRFFRAPSRKWVLK